MSEKEKRYYLKKGKSVVTMKRKCVGYVEGKAEFVTAKDFSRGEEAIKDLNTDKGPLTDKKPESVLDAEAKAKADIELKDRNAKQLAVRDAKIKVDEAKELLSSEDTKDGKIEAKKMLSDAEDVLRDLEK